MNVNEPSAEYAYWKPIWRKCRDFCSGQDRVIKAGNLYLPPLEGQDQEAYDKYLKSGYLYNASGRTRQGFVGMVMRKEPDVNLPASLEEFSDDVDQQGTKLIELAKKLITEELTVARGGLLVDFPDIRPEGMSQAEFEKLKARPYVAFYRAEDILSVRTKRIGSVTKVVQIRLLEIDEKEGENEFTVETVERVRVLDLHQETEGAPHFYRQRVFEDSGEGFEEIPGLETKPRIQGQQLDEIPFVFIGDYEFRDPHILDLVNANLQHYIQVADHRAGLKWTTRPQPWVTGQRKDDAENVESIGTGSIWYFPSTEAKVGLLEYSGSGLTAMEKTLDQLKEEMATLGARMIAPEKRMTETAEAHTIKRQGENSALGNAADRVSEALTKALEWCAKWIGVTEEVSIILNTDFIPIEMSADDVLKWTQALQTGQILPEDYYYALGQGEVLDPSITNEERMNRIQTTPPVI